MSVSVIIPVRNRPKSLIRAIQSVQAQTYPVEEIIIVDDESTDSTLDVARTASHADTRIKIIANSKRQGAAAARNSGVALAKSDWVAFLDSDDEWQPQKIEKQMAYLTSSPTLTAAFCGSEMISPDGHYTHTLQPSVTRIDLMKTNALGTTSSAVVRRSSFLEVGGFEAALPSCQDWDLWLKLFDKGTFAILPEALVNFYQDGADRISHNLDAVKKGHRIVFARILSQVQQPRIRRQVKAAHLNRMANIYLWNTSRPIIGAFFAIQSLALNPSKDCYAVLKQSIKRSILPPKRRLTS